MSKADLTLEETKSDREGNRKFDIVMIDGALRASLGSIYLLDDSKRTIEISGSASFTYGQSRSWKA